MSAAFKAIQTGSQSISADTWTVLNLNSESFDNSDEFDLSNDRFEPATAGYYRLTASIAWITNGDALHSICITRNGTRLAMSRLYTDTSGHSQTVSAIVYMDGSTHWADVRVRTTTAKSITVGAFCGEYIGNDTLFLARQSSDQYIPTDYLTKMPFFTEVYDPQSDWSYITNEWTPPSGMYRMTAHITWENPPDGTELRTYIYKNSSVIAEAKNVAPPDSTRFTQEVSTIHAGDGDDDFSVYVYQDSGDNVDVKGLATEWVTYFCGEAL